MAFGRATAGLRPARVAVVLALAAPACLAAAPAADADVFNGRIAFSSERAAAAAGVFDIFSMNADGSDVRRLTTNPRSDRQADWSPTGLDIAYSIDKPNATKNFEVARMTAAGTGHRQITTSPVDQASSQPSWRPDRKGILFRRSGPGRSASIWQMGLLGENPLLRFQPPSSPLYQTWSRDMKRVLFAAIL